MSFTLENRNGVQFHTVDQFTALGGTRHGFATRLGGVSQGVCAQLNLSRTELDTEERVRENYRLLCAALGTDVTQLVLSHQVHADAVRVVTRADVLADLYDPIPYEADGLITDIPGLTLTIFYADCIPILLYDPVRQVAGAVHSGWRGTWLGILNNAVETMTQVFGSDPQDIRAAIGPGICPKCFETHADVPDAMKETLGAAADPYITPLPGGKFQVDLKGLCRYRLESAGLLPQHVDVLEECTCCNGDLYWSHRRLGPQRGNQVAMIQLV